MRLPKNFRTTHPLIQIAPDDPTAGYYEFEHYSLPGYIVCCLASNGVWEHVAVTVRKAGQMSKRCPTWNTMMFVKGIFWEEEECVVQFHPPESEYVSNHPYCLHLWKHSQYEHATPPSWLIGIK